MDNLVLIRVAASLDASLRRATVVDMRQHSTHRFRLLFEQAHRMFAVAIGLRPKMPWVGRPIERVRRRPFSGASFTGAASHALRGQIVASVDKPRSDRRIRFTMVSGVSLVVELATHAGNLVLLDRDDRITAMLRRPRTARARLALGETYRPAGLPAHLFDPFGRGGQAIDAALSRIGSGDEPALETLRCRIFGVGSEGARLVVDEARVTGETPGTVLARRLGQLELGQLDPVVESPGEPSLTSSDPAEMRLLPWPPSSPRPGNRLFQEADPAATAGAYFEALDRQESVRHRGDSLRRLLDAEVQRLFTAELRADGDRRTFEDPGRFRLWGEALLAGLTRAVRIGAVARVPDPYAAGGDEISVPVKPGQSVERAAAEHFAQHRRATRGLEQATRRLQRLRRRRERLVALRERADLGGGLSPEQLETEMRREGLPVALESPHAAREGVRPRLERVRMLVGSDGTSILVGRSARDNHRLTFKLAGPEDFWFHVLGCTGAHVVVRNEARQARPSSTTLIEAAAVAAWYSEARHQQQADVQWTRRKYVRKPRGAPSGTVVVKRCETVRVRPALPGPSSEA